MPPHAGVALRAPRLRTKSACAPVLGGSYGWGHLGRRSRTARPPSAGRFVLFLELFDDRLGQVRRHLVVMRELLLECASALRDRATVTGEKQHLVFRHLPL